MLLKLRPSIKQTYFAQSKYRKGRREGIKEKDKLLCDPNLNSAGFSTHVLLPIDFQNIGYIDVHTRLLEWRNLKR